MLKNCENLKIRQKSYFNLKLVVLIIVFSFLSLNQTYSSFIFTEKDWFKEARIGGLSLSGFHITDEKIEELIDELKSQGVNVVELDSRMSDYLTQDEFNQQLNLIKRFSKIAHEKELKVALYYPVLEVITPEGIFKTSTMKKDHPDWLQLSFDGKTLGYFYGQAAFWLEKNDESAWMCPNGPYRNYFLEKLKKLSETEIDAFWLDVPNLAIGYWACSDINCRNKFEAQTGMKFPQKMNFKDKSFWRYVSWRHETLRELLSDCSKAIKSVNPQIRCITEVVSLDHLGATNLGLDGTYLRDNQVVWEVDCVSDTTGMKNAAMNDWLTQMIIFKFCKGAQNPEASWAFSYGYQDEDAQLVMALALAAQLNPYEAKAPRMITSVSRKFRTKMFKWIEKYSQEIFYADSKAEIGLLYSSRNRDFIDGAKINAHFTNPFSPSNDLLWWTGSQKESAYNTEYISEYRGYGKLMIKNNISFDVIPLNRLDLNKLENYKILILPNAVILDEDEFKRLLSFVENGGSLIISGKDAGLYDSQANIKNFWRSFKKEGTLIKYAEGKIYFLNKFLGKEFYYKEKDSIKETLNKIFIENKVFPLLSEASPIYLQRYALKNKDILHAVHYAWVEKKEFKPYPLKVNFSIPWDENKKVISIIQSSPEDTKEKEITFTQIKDKLNFSAEVNLNSLFIVNY
ncbi:MAG: beta-galactosidase trimerization domain-containing protein [Armatimonadetes bacterium]|nr:beta-galactosidase trimerization domain-containing protein [Armatimonadota bacterium]